MEFQTKANGKKIYPTQLKGRILSELKEAGVSPAELARRYQIPIQNIQRWKREAAAADQASYGGAAPEEVVAKSEVRALVEEYERQLKQLKRSLANMTVDRDILKAAVDIAAKKKWI